MLRDTGSTIANDRFFNFHVEIAAVAQCHVWNLHVEIVGLMGVARRGQ